MALRVCLVLQCADLIKGKANHKNHSDCVVLLINLIDVNCLHNTSQTLYCILKLYAYKTIILYEILLKGIRMLYCYVFNEAMLLTNKLGYDRNKNQALIVLIIHTLYVGLIPFIRISSRISVSSVLKLA